MSEPAHAQRDIYPGLDQIDIPIIEHHVDVEQWVLRHKNRQPRYDVETGEGHRCVDPQSPRQRYGGPATPAFPLPAHLPPPFNSLLESPPPSRRPPPPPPP